MLRIVLHIVFRRDLTADHSTSNAMKSGKWTDECKWIWLEDYDDSASEGQIVLFRKKFSLSKYPQNHVSIKSQQTLAIDCSSMAAVPVSGLAKVMSR